MPRVGGALSARYLQYRGAPVRCQPRAKPAAVLYSLEKAVRLLLKSNPNIVGLLWLREEEYIHRHPAFDVLRAKRDIFSSQAAAEAFAGYAADQLKRMEAFDFKRMAEYEALTTAIAAKGPVREVLEADTQKLRHIAANWGFNSEVLTRFRKLHREHFSGYWRSTGGSSEREPPAEGPHFAGNAAGVTVT